MTFSSAVVWTPLKHIQTETEIDIQTDRDRHTDRQR